MPKILVQRLGQIICIEVSKRRYRNHKARCDCVGWWFPHRIRSRASPDTFKTKGTLGCHHAPLPNIVVTQVGFAEVISFTDACPF